MKTWQKSVSDNQAIYLEIASGAEFQSDPNKSKWERENKG